MRCLILSGGKAPEKQIIQTHADKADMTIGVDGAADLFYRYHIVPDVLIGDFDTADAACVTALAQSGAKVLRLPCAKNETDTEAAVNYALKAGVDEIFILGALGSRMDHTLSNILMLVRADKAGVQCRIIDEHNELMVSDRDFCLVGTAGQTVSILPLTGEVCITTTDLKYPLDGLVLPFDSSRGISNEMLKDTANIKITGGYALIIKTDADA